MKSIMVIVLALLMNAACTPGEQADMVATGEESTDSGIITSGPDHHFLVKLTSSMSTQDNNPGDAVTGMLIMPTSLRGGLVEGTITRADRSFLRFSFHTVIFDGKSYPIETVITGVVSSKGNVGQDDLRQRIRVAGGGIIAYGTEAAIDEGAEIYLVAWDKGT
jgi:Zn-dependent M16 (insulinase) family peptidase